MKPVSIPRSLIIFIFVLVALTFLAGTLHTFGSAGAVALGTPTATAIAQAGNEAGVTPTPEPTPVQTPALVSADTTGIIALAIVIVIIVAVGAILSLRRPRKKQVP
jgi:hypothetical protein